MYKSKSKILLRLTTIILLMILSSSEVIAEEVNFGFETGIEG
ncbi:MAG: hypothetical protein AB1414_12415 [bacterium]